MAGQKRAAPDLPTPAARKSSRGGHNTDAPTARKFLFLNENPIRKFLGSTSENGCVPNRTDLVSQQGQCKSNFVTLDSVQN